MEDLAVNKYRKAAAFLRNTVLENLRNYAETLTVPIIVMPILFHVIRWSKNYQSKNQFTAGSD